ncbi:hypothetical protein [Streptomyces yerevanensis]|uniref:hypothetical protein n=1 Tax=Streptomyces yerevanensis TaxID=66378 RepID=UPI000ABD5D43|nr:hypothetical protein [Streptomyces yerevanensis]
MTERFTNGLFPVHPGSASDTSLIHPEAESVQGRAYGKPAIETWNDCGHLTVA